MSWTTPTDLTAGELTVAELNAIVENLRVGFPAGKLEFFIRAATTVETTIAGGWLECNGVAVSRATYAALNTVLSGLSYPFGSGDGSTTFNLPDLQGRVLVAMASGGHADVNALGDSDGLAKASRTPKVIAHAHTGGAHTHGAGSYVATPTTVGRVSGATNTADAGGAPVAGTSSSSGAVLTTDSGAVPGNFLVPGVWAVKF